MALPRRQKMLKDFLMEPDLYSLSSRDFFRSLQLRPTAATSSPGKKNSKTRSTLQAMVTKVVNAIPRTLSKKQRNNNNGKLFTVDERDREGDVAVTVKDIIGWRSFRDDVVVGDSVHPASPEGCTTVTTGTTSSSSSEGSASWCDSDFTAEYSPLWCGKGDIIIELGETYYSPNNCYVGHEDYVEKSEISFSAMQMEPNKLKEQEQEVQEQGHDDQEQESYDPEYKAVRLLKEVRASTPSNYNINNDNADWVLLDFFRNELRETRYRTGRFNGSGYDHGLVKTAVSWLEGDYDSSSYEWGVEKSRVGYKRDMDRGMWGGSKEEQDEVGEGIEGEVLSLLVCQLVEEALEV